MCLKVIVNPSVLNNPPLIQQLGLASPCCEQCATGALCHRRDPLFELDVTQCFKEDMYLFFSFTFQLQFICLQVCFNPCGTEWLRLFFIFKVILKF